MARRIQVSTLGAASPVAVQGDAVTASWNVQSSSGTGLSGTTTVTAE